MLKILKYTENTLFSHSCLAMHATILLVSYLTFTGISVVNYYLKKNCPKGESEMEM